jgi:hypothetical protein
VREGPKTQGSVGSIRPGRNIPIQGPSANGGKRVLDWELDAISRSPYVVEIYLIGLSPTEFPSALQLNFIPISTTSTILEKIILGSTTIQEDYPELEHLVLSTGDTPGMMTESVDQFFEAFLQNRDTDVLIAGVPEDITREIFPDHRRIVAKFRYQSIYPGEMLVLKHSIIPFLKKEIDQQSVRRRQFNRRADTSRLGPVLRYLAQNPSLWLPVIKSLTGSLSVGQAERMLCRAFQMTIKSVIIPDPGFGIDLDLPEDYQELTDYILKTKCPEK